MARRYRTGKRNYMAYVERHTGEEDPHGMPTYSADNEWCQVIRWPCEVIGATGGEVIRGRQTSAYTSHVLYGDYKAAKKIKQSDRIKITIDGTELYLGILSIRDAEGDLYEMVIDARHEE